MTAGRGWIALALVVFASWRPWRVLLGALSLRRDLRSCQLHAQAFRHAQAVPLAVPVALPYLATVVVLV